MTREEQIKELWEKAYKHLPQYCSNQLTLEEICCMFFELGWRAADESMIDKACEWIKLRYTIPYNGKVDENNVPDASGYLEWVDNMSKEATYFTNKFKKAMFNE